MMNPNPTIINMRDRVEELNQRILGRNTGYGNQDALLDVRSVATKYTFPLQAATPKCSQPVVRSNVFSTLDTYATGDSKYPWNGYVSNINNESILRNQVFALQRSPQAYYVPNSNSDLYTSTVRPSANNQDGDPEQLFPNLFRNSIAKQILNAPLRTPILFNNDTRQQLKDS